MHRHGKQNSSAQPAKQKTSHSSAKDRGDSLIKLLRSREVSERMPISMQLIFGYYRFTLFEEIGRRKAMKLNFEETELWFLLYHLLQASATFQRRKQKSGDIRPRNVLIDEKGEVAVLNTLSFPDELTNYYKSLYNAEKTYLGKEYSTQRRRNWQN